MERMPIYALWKLCHYARALESAVSKGSRHYVMNFGSYLLPEAEQVHTRAPVVMVEDSRWEQIVVCLRKGCVD